MLAATVAALALALTEGAVGPAPARLGPWFAEQPPPQLRYAAAAGARLACGARGEPPPRVAWLGEDGAELLDEPGVRRTYSNGTLELFPSARDEPGVVRCRAASAHGAVVSRDVLLEPVPDAPWVVSLSDATVAAGGVAALWCRSEPAALAAPALFYRGEEVLQVDAPSPGDYTLSLLTSSQFCRTRNMVLRKTLSLQIKVHNHSLLSSCLQLVLFTSRYLLLLFFFVEFHGINDTRLGVPWCRIIVTGINTRPTRCSWQ
ncbi:cell adhesion molecule Dscam2-like [Bicyclus anynana]|uniref:Cell adhesion molecule Dscam2-like n=1 Tax=Bicyclus anynana TaxID=110368 RepID=A0ABM3M8S9_BICAN|nr:cell adhesion molecule Dscam2-like [Bicyclus anynana]XP_052747420.1 cell adhesion molecule Dscam2-like [Bicyclus anynana]